MSPAHDFIAVPIWLIDSLHLITLTLHFLAMNFLFGGTVVAVFGPIENRWQNPAVRKYLKLLPIAMAATISLGVAPLLFLQLLLSTQMYSASIVSGWFWLLIVPVAVVVYYCLYIVAFKTNLTAPVRIVCLSLALAGFVYISFIYSSVFALVERQDLVKSIYQSDQSGWSLNPAPGTYFLRWMHMLLGAVTVGGFFFGVIGRDNNAAHLAGRNFFLWGMVGSMVVGLAYLMSLADILVAFMGTLAVWWLLGGIVLSALSLHFFFKRKFLLAGIVVSISVLSMVVVRHYVRRLNLSAAEELGSMIVHPQWAAIALFLVCFVLAVATIVYMIRLYFRDSASSPA